MQSHERPFCALNFRNFLWCDQPDNLAFFNHDKTAPTRTEEFLIDEILDIQPSFNCWTVPGHHIRNAHARERMSQVNLDITLPRSLQQEPANECNPQTSDSRASK